MPTGVLLPSPSWPSPFTSRCLERAETTNHSLRSWDDSGSYQISPSLRIRLEALLFVTCHRRVNMDTRSQQGTNVYIQLVPQGYFYHSHQIKNLV